MLTHENVEQIHHIARMAVLAMCARGVASAEFEASPEVQSVVIRISRVQPAEVSVDLPVDIEFVGTHAIPLGGMSL